MTVYANRVATSSNTDVYLIMRKTTLANPVPYTGDDSGVGFTDGVPNVARPTKNGLATTYLGPVAGTGGSSNPVSSGATFTSILGFLDGSWGRYTSATDVYGSGTKFQLGLTYTQGVVMSIYNGAPDKPSEVGLGDWQYWMAADFFSGFADEDTVVGSLNYISQNVHIGTTGGAVISYTCYGAAEATFSGFPTPKIWQFENWQISGDIFGQSNIIIGIEMSFNAVDDYDVTVKALMDMPQVPGFQMSNFSGIITSDVTPWNNWAMAYVSDFSTTRNMLMRFDSDIDLFDGGIQYPNCDTYNAIIHYNGRYYGSGENGIGGGEEFNVKSLGTSWIVGAIDHGNVSGVDQRNPLIINAAWQQYRHYHLIGGEQEWCDAINNGAFLYWYMDASEVITIAMVYGGEVSIWTEGTMDPAFTGCSFDPDPPAARIPNLPGLTTGTVQLRVWAFTLDEHDFYILRLGLDFTMVYDTLSKQWAEWSSYNNAVWAVNCGFEWVGGIGLGATNVVVGDDTTGTLYFLDPDSAEDDASTVDFGIEYFQRIAMGQVPVRGRDAIPCFGTWLTTEMGQPVNDGALVTLYTSDDAGVSWINHGDIPVTSGATSPELAWYSLGQMQAPGRLFMIIDDGAIQRIDTLEMADPNGR